MLFAIICTDRPGSLEIRRTTREAHLGYLSAQGDRVVHGGPLLGVDGQPCGSLVIVEAADRTAALDLAANDPYALAGLFEDVAVREHRTVFRDGVRVG